MAALWALRKDETMIFAEQNPITADMPWIKVIEDMSGMNGAGPSKRKANAIRQFARMVTTVGNWKQSQAWNQSAENWNSNMVELYI